MLLALLVMGCDRCDEEGLTAALSATPGAAEGADALIVGSSLKQDGVWTNPVDPARLEALARAFAKLPSP